MSGPFRVLYADPPWRFRNKKMGGNHTSGAAQKYATLKTHEIAEIPVSKVVAKDAVGYVWVPASMMPDGLLVLAHWGFTYKGTLVWEKTGRFGTGYWFRNHMELLLFGVRGKVKAFRTAQPNVIHHPVLGHSEKPSIFREIVQGSCRQWKDPQRLELFARGAEVEGWRFTGLESDGLDVMDPKWAEKLVGLGG